MSTDRFDDLNPAVAEAARACLNESTEHGVGSPEHEAAKRHLARVARRVLAGTVALRSALDADEASHE